MRPLACRSPFDVKASLTGSSFSFFTTASASFVPWVHRLEILQRGGIGAGLDHVRHPPGALKEALAEFAGPVVEVPIIALGQHQTLRGLQSEAVDFRQGQTAAPRAAGRRRRSRIQLLA